jgi:cytochrome c5
VNKLLQRIFSKKRNVLILIFLCIALGGTLIYVITGIQSNIAEMQAGTEAVTYFPPYPPLKVTGKKADLIKRGEYLTKAGDCIACHTNTTDKGPAFAGGLAMQTPFGVIYTPNITPDKATGIGSWTDAEFLKAMHEGISPQGEYYYPAFPYLYFNKITKEDVLAIKAYLDSIPAVNQKNRPNEMVWPFSWRFLQFGWRLLFFHPHKTSGYTPHPDYSAEWNRGAYLTEGLGHCAMCHTPSYNILSADLPLGAPIRKYDLTGGRVQGFLAPNIMKANIGNVSDEEFIQVFTHNRMIGGGKVEGPMLEVNEDSLKHLSHSDLLAIVTYLKSVNSQLPPKPKASRGSPGKPTYEVYCAACHATGAGGAPKYGDPISWDPLIKKGITTLYTTAITGIGGMPAKGTCFSCTDEEIKEAVDYMTASVAGKVVKIIPPIKKLTLADGQHIYEEKCSVCHRTGIKNAPKPGDISAWKPMVAAGFFQTYKNVLYGHKGHPPRGGCSTCSDAELIAAVKYMMQKSAPNENYSLW